MKVFVLLREDQNDHGFVDTSIDGVFSDQRHAREQEAFERQAAREEGLIVDEPGEHRDWQVSWKIEEHDVS